MAVAVQVRESRVAGGLRDKSAGLLDGLLAFVRAAVGIVTMSSAVKMCMSAVAMVVVMLMFVFMLVVMIVIMIVAAFEVARAMGVAVTTENPETNNVGGKAEATDN